MPALLDVAHEADARTAVVTAQPAGEAPRRADMVVHLPAQTMADDRGLATTSNCRSKLGKRHSKSGKCHWRESSGSAFATKKLSPDSRAPRGRGARLARRSRPTRRSTSPDKRSSSTAARSSSDWLHARAKQIRDKRWTSITRRGCKTCESAWSHS